MTDIAYGSPLRIAEFKSDGDALTVSGYVSTYGNVDHGGDVVSPGAFDAYLAAKSPVRFLFAHDTHQVLGKPLELKTDEKGLFGRFLISQTTLGRDIHTLLKDGALDSFSIGYIPTDVEFKDDGMRLLKGVDLLECSVVAMPMNEHATVTAVKSHALDEDVPFEKLLAQVGGYLTLATEAAEALQVRRAEDGRKLAAAHVDAIYALLEQAEASTERLEQVANPPSPPDDGMKLRLELARKLDKRRALLETT